MPFSILLQGYPTSDARVSHVQGPILQGMLLHLMSDVDPGMSDRLHHEQDYRPYTLSPLGIGDPLSGPQTISRSSAVEEEQAPPRRNTRKKGFEGFWLSRHDTIRRKMPCYVRITMLEDDLFPVFGRYFMERSNPTFRLGATKFVVTNVMDERSHPHAMRWTQYFSYKELIEQASWTERKIRFVFLTPSSFRHGDIDFPMPVPRLVFESYRRRFEEFYDFEFLPDFGEQVECHTGVANMKRIETQLIKTKKVPLVGFTGGITYQLDKNASPKLIYQMNLLANYAFFCGTGRKTTVGMGQTVRI